MKRNNLLKGLLLGAIGFATLGIAACGDNETKDTFTGFLPGVAVEMQRRDTLFLDEFIVYPTDDATYTITLQCKGGELQDLTDESFLELFEAGEYTLTYTIHDGKNAGTYVHTFYVPYDTVQWAYTAAPIDIQYQTELSFERLLAQLNIAVMSHTEEEWDFYVKSIRIGDEIINVDANATSYYINSLATHYITYGIKTVDGQKGQSIVTANVYFSDTVSNLYLNALNSTGTYEFAVNGATEVKVNGEVCNDVTIESDKIVFQKQDLYEKYSGTNFVSITTANGEVRDTINVYTESVSFEEDNLMAPAFFKVYAENIPQEDGQKRIVNRFATEGDMALEVTAPHYYWPWFAIDLDYLDVLFSDSEVNAFSFDITYAGKTAEQAYRDLAVWVYGKTGLLYRNEPRTITMTRAHYEKLKADIATIQADPDSAASFTVAARVAAMTNTWPMQLQNTREAVGGYDQYPKLYFDNFRAVSILEAQTYAANDTSEGDLVIDVANITKVTMNGKAIPEDKIQITENYAVVDKDWILTHAGSNLLTIKAERKTYELTVNIYQVENDFEDGVVPGFITASVGSVSVADYNGSKALQFVVGEGKAQWPQFTISNDYLKLAFENADALTTLTWELTMEFTPRAMDANDNNPYDFIGLTTTPAVLSSMSFRSGEKKTFSITKAQYEALNGSNLVFTWMNQWANTGCAALTWYIDNIKLGEGEKIVIPNFDEGDLNILGYTTLGNGSAIQSYYGSTNSDSTQKAGYSGLTTDQRILYQTAGGLTSEATDKALALNFQWKCPDVWKVGFAIAWLDAVFADENVKGMQFSMKVGANSNATGISTDVAQSWTASMAIDTAWHTLIMTRADYNAIKAATSLEVDGFLTISLNKSGTNYGAAFWCLFDGFEAVTTEIPVPTPPSGNEPGGNEPGGNQPTVDETALTLNFNDLTLGAADSARYYLSGNATDADNVMVNTFGYNEFVNNDTSADEKALKFYMSNATVRQYMYVNIVLTDAMKAAIADGATLSFAYAMNRCKNSGYTTYNLLAGANGGSATQQLVSASTVGWDGSGGGANGWGPRSVDSASAAVTQWATLTITDATVLSELASTGILQITIDACNWNKKHETNFWIDNITVVNE